jgi:hypothetical protein
MRHLHTGHADGRERSTREKRPTEAMVPDAPGASSAAAPAIARSSRRRSTSPGGSPPSPGWRCGRRAVAKADGTLPNGVERYGAMRRPPVRWPRGAPASCQRAPRSAISRRPRQPSRPARILTAADVPGAKEAASSRHQDQPVLADGFVRFAARRYLPCGRCRDDRGTDRCRDTDRLA